MTLDLLVVPNLKRGVLRYITNKVVTDTIVSLFVTHFCRCSGVLGYCEDDFSGDDAEVVLRQLGYPTTDAKARGDAKYGQGIGTIWLDNVGCHGSESRLSDCDHNGRRVEDCMWPLGRRRCDCSKLSWSSALVCAAFIC